MTGPLPQAPQAYEVSWLQQALQSIEASIDDLSSRLQRSGQVASKAEDETRTESATLADDAELFFPTEEFQAYRFRFGIFYETHADADFQFDVNGPSSPGLVRMVTRTLAPNASAYADISMQESFGFTPIEITAAGGTAGFIEVEGILQNGANAGGVVFRWAQGVSDVNDTKVLAGSVVEYKLI